VQTSSSLAPISQERRWGREERALVRPQAIIERLHWRADATQTLGARRHLLLGEFDRIQQVGGLRPLRGGESAAHFQAAIRLETFGNIKAVQSRPKPRAQFGFGLSTICAIAMRITEQSRCTTCSRPDWWRLAFHLANGRVPARPTAGNRQCSPSCRKCFLFVSTIPTENYGNRPALFRDHFDIRSAQGRLDRVVNIPSKLGSKPRGRPHDHGFARTGLRRCLSSACQRLRRAWNSKCR
jgi:hypothetical protein